MNYQREQEATVNLWIIITTTKKKKRDDHKKGAQGQTSHLSCFPQTFGSIGKMKLKK